MNKTIYFFFLLYFLIISENLLISQEQTFNTTNLRFSLSGDTLRNRGHFIYPDDVSIRVDVEGAVARTTMEFTLVHNYEDRMEASLNFSLPLGSVMTGLKLEIQGKMVSGVGVERNLARQAYFSETGRRVDPALLMKLNEESYQLRVYPLDQGVGRKVEIQWIQPLFSSGTNSYVFRLPFHTRSPVDCHLFQYRIPGDYVIENVWAEWLEGSQRESYNEGIFLSRSDMQIPLSRREGVSLIAPGLQSTQWILEREGFIYSSIYDISEDHIQIEPAEQTYTIIWDASFNRQKQNKRSQMDLLKRILSDNDAPTVRLFILRNVLEGPVSFQPGSDESYESLFSFLDDLVYDGYSDASRLAGLAFPTGPDDISLFFTGMLEESNVEDLDFHTPLHVFAHSSYWHTFDRLIATLSKGFYYPLYNNSISHISDRFRINSHIESIGPYHGFSFGEIKEKRLYAVHGKTDQLPDNDRSRKMRTFRWIDNYHLYIEGMNAERSYHWWAHNYDSEISHPSALDMVSSFSSLLVLESPAQYVRWGIEPPDDVPWDYEEYEILLDERKSRKADADHNFLNLVSSLENWSEGDPVQYTPLNKTYADFSEETPLSELPPKNDGYWGFGGCFPGDTQIQGAMGLRQIRELKVDEAVFSYDPLNGRFSVQKIIGMKTYRYSGDLIHLILGDETIKATGNHPVLVLSGENLFSRPVPSDISLYEFSLPEKGRWVEARDLIPGDMVLGNSGKKMIVTSMASEVVEAMDVYNLELSEYHTYLVGKSGLIVHNEKEAGESVDFVEEPKFEDRSTLLFSSSAQSASHSYEESISYYNFKDHRFHSDEEAYALYLAKRAEINVSVPFFTEAARWFYENGSYFYGDRILSNCLEHIGRGSGNALAAAFLCEKLGMYEKAIDILESQRKSIEWFSPSMILALSSLYREIGKEERSMEILREEIPYVMPSSGSTDSSGTEQTGGPFLSLYLEYLHCSKGINDLPDQFRLEPQTVRWNYALNFTALWEPHVELSLLVVEPSGEAVFYDNVRSESGGLYFTDFWNVWGPDKYIHPDPPQGTYDIYIVRKNKPYFNGHPYTTIKLIVNSDMGSNKEKEEIHIIDIPIKLGIYKIMSLRY